jgi:hypothetical protein
MVGVTIDSFVGWPGHTLAWASQGANAAFLIHPIPSDPSQFFNITFTVNDAFDFQGPTTIEITDQASSPMLYPVIFTNDAVVGRNVLEYTFTPWSSNTTYCVTPNDGFGLDLQRIYLVAVGQFQPVSWGQSTAMLLGFGLYPSDDVHIDLTSEYSFAPLHARLLM